MHTTTQGNMQLGALVMYFYDSIANNMKGSQSYFDKN